MSLQKKILLGFFISSALIAVLAAFAYTNFIEIRKNIRYLELSDTLRSKTLQLRRHEKNFLLYRDSREQESIHAYIREINAILEQNAAQDATGQLAHLESRIKGYDKIFGIIEENAAKFLDNIGELKRNNPQYSLFFPLMEATFLESPAVNAKQIEQFFRPAAGSGVLANLSAIEAAITSLRKTGEEILTISKDLDTSMREKVDNTIRISQTTLLILFPLFLVTGFTALFLLIRSTVRQLNILARAIEKTGKGDFSTLPAPSKHDEVGMLVESFNRMERDLIERDREISRKNDELLQSRKLASIGTLASGVAHELNNPLNNIYLSAQILTSEIRDEKLPDIIKETVNDIFSQSLRMKRIVSDLLEFSREKPPHFTEVQIAPLIRDIVKNLSASGELDNITVRIEGGQECVIRADRHLMEQLFINLFTNAVHAMAGKGTLGVSLQPQDGVVTISVSDTGPGIPEKDLARVFDPFFTTKEKGTGLGLAIVYNIVQKHFGTISVSSVPNQGTTFRLSLPEEQ